MPTNNKVFLDSYLNLLKNLPADLKVKKLYQDIYCISSDNLNATKKIGLVALTHGDEVIGLHIFIKLLEKLASRKLKLDGELILVLGNRGAYLQNQRYVETDLNRSYGQNTGHLLEEKRAKVIKQALNACDYIIDIHQCIEETLHPFFILPFSEAAYAWITTVAPGIPIIIKDNISKATTLSTYGFLAGKKSVTFEVGDFGFDSKQLNFGFNTIENFLNFAWNLKNKIDASSCKTPTQTYEIKYFQPYSQGEVIFSKAFKNFESVEKGQVIAFLNKKSICTPVSGKILLYPKKWFEKGSPIKADGLFFVLKERQVQNNVEVTDYDPKWVQIFEKEKKLIKEALGDNCLSVYHIGSTAVPGLSAKPIIDIMPVVSNIKNVDICNKAMEKLGYKTRGESGILFRRFFKKEGFNVHVYQEGACEIQRHLKFRDWLVKNPSSREEYKELKTNLAKKYPYDIFSYCLGKEAFINKIDDALGFEGLRIVLALTNKEWDAVKKYRRQYFLKKDITEEPYIYNHKNHSHFILYKGIHIIGYAHLHFLSERKVFIKILITEKKQGKPSYEKEFRSLLEKWIKTEGYTDCSEKKKLFSKSYDYKDYKI